MEVPIVSRLMRMEPSLAVLLVVTIGAVAIVGFVAVVTTPVGILVGDERPAGHVDLRRGFEGHDRTAQRGQPDGRGSGQPGASS